MIFTCHYKTAQLLTILTSPICDWITNLTVWSCGVFVSMWVTLGSSLHWLCFRVWCQHVSCHFRNMTSRHLSVLTLRMGAGKLSSLRLHSPSTLPSHSPSDLLSSKTSQSTFVGFIHNLLKLMCFLVRSSLQIPCFQTG